MSYRELRNFTEMMRGLGYPRLISMENFRKPNFELVADILYWMVKLYDPEMTISDRVEYENERVEFLTSIAALLANKARLKLNTKKLYASDGRAVQELLKLATLLYKAAKTVNKKAAEEPMPPSIKVQDIRTARTLASEITQTGAKLYDLLENEANERIERGRSLRFLDQAATTAEGSKEQAYIERKVREIIENTKQSLEDARKESEENEAEKRNVENKIIKKQEELERTEKRLKSLENVRPQFMEEAEKLEQELQRYYDIYMEKHRNLDYLEQELEKYRRQEEEQMKEHERKLKKMRERLLKEEVDLMRGGGRTDEDEEERAYYRKERISSGGNERSSSNGRNTKVQGSMNAKYESSEEGSEDENEEDEELSVNERVRSKVGNGRSNESKSNGSSSGGRVARRESEDNDDFLNDEDEDEEGEDDDGEGDDGELSGSDDF